MESTENISKQIQMLHELILAQGESIRAELRSEIAALRTELKEEMSSLRSEFHEFRQDVRAEFRRIDDRFERLENRVEKLEDKIEKLYEERRSVTVSFTRAWAFASFFIAVFAASTAFVIGKIVV